MNKYFFILGGIDLEMLEIKNILEEQKIEYANDSLSWDKAFWKNYRDIALKKQKEGYRVVSVELLDKKDKPSCDIIDIDHHNYDRSKPASIEQVAQLLNIELTPWQKMVAINDKAYITGLLKANATFDEINKIRHQDRQAQGLNDADFINAQNYLKEHAPLMDKKTGLLILKAHPNLKDFVSLKDAFFLSRLSDCLNEGKTNIECEKELEKIKLIIYNKHKFNYSGYIPAEILEKYSRQIEGGDAYFGGTEKSAYFGFINNYVLKRGSKKILKEWQDLMEKTKSNIEEVQNKKMYSYHIFLFPFRWKNWISEDSLNHKFSLDKFEKALINKEWERRPYTLNHAKTYNEYNYFYDFVREILFDLDDDLITESNKNNDKLIRHFEYSPADITHNNSTPLYYEIKLKNESYKLEIDSIILNVYGTGVGVISLHLRNKIYNNPKDILKINKFGRRLYVPFMFLEDQGINTGCEIDNNDNRLQFVSNNELPESIRLIQNGITFKDSFEDFKQYTTNDYIKYGPFRLPAFIKALFPEKFFLTHEKLGCLEYDYKKKICKTKDEMYKIYLRPALNDDRMFVISWYANNDKINFLQKFYYDNKKNYYYQKPENYNFTKSDFWHNYIFIDTYRMYQNKLKLPEFVDRHTYSRWIDDGTLFGMSRYSLVMLTNENAPAFLIRHLQTMYYKMAELALIQRASVVSFSDEVTHVSDLAHGDEDKAIEKIEDLYKHYILFVNKIYFREITAQEQGIEMYDMMQRIMRIPEQVKDLDDEIAELNAFAGMIADKNGNLENKKLSHEANSLTKIGVYFAIASILTGLLGMNIMPEPKEIPKFLFGNPYWAFWIGTVIITLITLLFSKIIIKKLENK